MECFFFYLLPFFFLSHQSEEWKKVSSMNNLNDVYQLHCGGEPLEKAKRDVFVEGTMKDVREQFQVSLQIISGLIVPKY